VRRLSWKVALSRFVFRLPRGLLVLDGELPLPCVGVLVTSWTIAAVQGRLVKELLVLRHVLKNQWSRMSVRR
jgi:hypothetical protein